jgi:hypothetical protein
VLYADVASLIQYHRVPASTGSWLGLVAVVYAAGVVPAAMTGVVWNLVLRRLSAAWRLSLGFRLVLGALTGAASCVAAGALVRAWEVTPSFFAQFCIRGAIAGAILAAIFPRTVSWMRRPTYVGAALVRESVAGGGAAPALTGL